MVFWRPHRESNPELALRRGLLYPFNYEDKIDFLRIKIIIQSVLRNEFITFIKPEVTLCKRAINNVIFTMRKH